MYILDKLNKQINSLSVEFTLIVQENINLKNQIEELKNQNDQLKYNNENMLLNIDKALNIPQKIESSVNL
jgi:chromosome segregation ATPase